ncbi:MAG: polysaccharide deacetylase family protein [Lachnospiraceae bacterium]|mgnify:CR=1 FL=1|jgi:polysaccharide deacetylase family sporulation protein PdaB|nr:polysaccharide deacetylase family protein [Lachnospiraceae bacterium]GFI04070.1 peptidoglycan-N-acetylglucosamine deacetylase [Lachnospiraceae bacterium]
MKKYIEKVKQLIRIFPPRQEGQSGEEYAKQRVILGMKYGAFALAAFAVLRGMLVVAGESVTVSNSVDGRELPIYCVETQEKKIALSFDAAWGNEDTAKILEILKKHDVHVTFFMTGGWVESYPDDVKAILAAGHDLGNHSENHKNMSQLSDEEKKEELMQVHTKVQELTGYDMFLFRPPYGDYDNAVVNVAKDCGYYTIQWDVDSLDWKDYGVDSIIKTVTQHKHLGNGSIILCHNGAKYTAQALDTLIATLKNEGYTFVPLSELIYKDGYHMNHEGRQIKNN